MPNTWFQFKQFTIEQEHAAMKVGTDGVLLGAWATAPGPESRILDVGTGTGLIALMLAQRTSNVVVDALEIDHSSARQAEENFQSSPWKEKLHCIQSSFQDYSSRCKSRYDLIICNPPYFSASAKTPSKERNLARHDDSLSLEDLFRASLPLMKKTCIISLILPYEKETRGMELISEYKLYCNRITRVIPAPGKAIKRVLLECSYFKGTPHEDELTIETEIRHQYSNKFNELVDDFYL